MKSPGEATSHALLAQRGLAPPLLARFENGLLYRFIRGRVAAPVDLVQSHVWRGVARRLGQWHAALPIISVSSSPVKSIPARRLDVDAERIAPVASTGHITPIQPRQAGPNLWTVLQKWILALPAATDEQKSRQKGLQKELERIIGELDDGAGIGKGGARIGTPKNNWKY